MVSPITKTDRCEMPTPSLPAASLSRHIRFPARQALLGASNYLIYLVLSSIGGAMFQAQSKFLPAVREGGAPAGGNFGSRGDRRHALLTDCACGSPEHKIAQRWLGAIWRGCTS